MTTSYTKSLTLDFIGNLNIIQLQDEINLDSTIAPNCITVTNNADVVKIIFDSALSGGEQTTLNNLIAAHTPSNYVIPLETSVTILAGDTHNISHTSDPSYIRKVTIHEDNNSTFDDTKFIIDSAYSSDYTISDEVNSELSDIGFTLVGAGYSEGSSISHNGTASASSTTQPASNAIDQNTGTFWYNSSSEPPVGAWWKLDFGSVTGIYSTEVIWYSTSYYATDVSIEYSNDDQNWTLALRDQSCVYTSSGNSTGQYKFADFSNPIFARYFRFTCNASVSSSYFIFREVYLYEASANGFPTGADSTISNIKANRQIDSVNWSLINSSTLNGTFPAGTSTKMLLSFDDQTTWVYWNGSAWTTTILANIDTNYMTHTTFDGLSTANYAAANGFNSSTNTIDVAINISTSDSTKTPIVTDVTFNLTTNNFREVLHSDTIRIRYITPTKTEFKNISTESKSIIATISLD